MSENHMTTPTLKPCVAERALQYIRRGQALGDLVTTCQNCPNRAHDIVELRDENKRLRNHIVELLTVCEDYGGTRAVKSARYIEAKAALQKASER